MYETSVTTTATPDAVWDAMVDVADWPRWTTSVRKAELLDSPPLRLGSRVRLFQPQLPATVWTVTEFEPGRRFVWTSGGGLVASEAVHEVAAEGGLTRVHLMIRWTGPLGGVMTWLARRNGPRYLALEAAGMAAAAEAAEAAGPTSGAA